MTRLHGNFEETLNTLEGEDWGEPDYGSYVVRTVHALRKKRLLDLTNEELRLALSQRVGLPYILDLAFSRLRMDPFIGGDFYNGDIIAALVLAEQSIWQDRSDLRNELAGLLQKALVLADTDEFSGGMLREAIRRPADRDALH